MFSEWWDRQLSRAWKFMREAFGTKNGADKSSASAEKGDSRSADHSSKDSGIPDSSWSTSRRQLVDDPEASAGLGLRQPIVP